MKMTNPVTTSKQQEDKTVRNRQKNTATTTTMSSSSSPLTIRQLEDVRDVIRRPLQNRSILIPLGSKAFVEGRLVPTASAHPNDNHEKEERVLLRTAMVPEDGSTTTTSTTTTSFVEREMSRQDALEALSKEIQTLKLDNRKKQVPSKPSSSSSSSATPAAIATKTSKPQFFEIREEINENGHEIQSQVLDISNQVQLLETTTDSRSDHSEKEFSTTDSGDHDPEHDPMDPPVAEQQHHLRTLSDAEYDVLAARLDELAKLEEQHNGAAVEKRSPIKGMRKDNKSDSKTVPPPNRNLGWSKGFLNNPSKSQKIKPTKVAVAQPTDDEPAEQDRKKTIVFGENEIREIPPEGNQRSTAEARPRHPQPSKPMDPNVFGGVVHEHRKSHGRNRYRQGMQETTDNRQQQQQGTHQKGKRLSKFAQERQMGLR